MKYAADVMVYVHTRFHKDWFRHSNIDRWDIQTHGQHGYVISLLLEIRLKVYKRRTKDGITLTSISWTQLSLDLFNDTLSTAQHNRFSGGPWLQNTGVSDEWLNKLLSLYVFKDATFTYNDSKGSWRCCIHSELLAVGLCTLNNTKGHYVTALRKLNIFRPQVREWETPTLLSPFEERER
jgi:hypothetical protein